MSKRPVRNFEHINTLVSEEPALHFTHPKEDHVQELLEQLMVDFEDIKDQYGQIAAYAMFPESALKEGVSHLTTPEGVNFTMETGSIHISEGAVDEGPNSYKTILTIPVSELKKQLYLTALYVKTRLNEHDGSYVLETSSELPLEDFENIFAITLEKALIEKYLEYLDTALENILEIALDIETLLAMFTPKIMSEDLFVLEDNEDYAAIVLAKNENRGYWEAERFPSSKSRPQEIDVWLNSLKGKGNHPKVVEEYEEVIVSLMPGLLTEEIPSIAAEEINSLF
jgi:hypothetical protein